MDEKRLKDEKWFPEWLHVIMKVSELHEPRDTGEVHALAMEKPAENKEKGESQFQALEGKMAKLEAKLEKMHALTMDNALTMDKILRNMLKRNSRTVLQL